MGVWPLSSTAPNYPVGKGWVTTEDYDTDSGIWWAKLSLLQKKLSYTGQK